MRSNLAGLDCFVSARNAHMLSVKYVGRASQSWTDLLLFIVATMVSSGPIAKSQ
jgi:hypothetical protein